MRAQTLGSDCQHPGSNDTFIGHVGKSVADAASSVSGCSVGSVADAASSVSGYSVGPVTDAASSVSGCSVGSIADAASHDRGYVGAGVIARSPRRMLDGGPPKKRCLRLLLKTVGEKAYIL